MRSRLFALALACQTVGCGRNEPTERPEPTEPTGPTESPLTPDAYFATNVGDRFRFRGSDGAFAHVGVTGRDAAGRVATHGTHRTTVTFHEVGPGGVYVVAPDGTRLHPVLEAPLTAGREQRYTLGEAGRCTLRVTSNTATAAVAGASFARCVTVLRTCELTASGGLPRPTRTTEDETYCPAVGLVHRRFVADPPLPFPGVSSDSREELVGFHVRGAPRMAESTPLADRMIVLPSDVSAACGAATTRSVLSGDATTPRLAFESAAGTFVVAAGPTPPTPAGTGPTGVVTTPRGSVHFAAPETCRREDAARIVPLLESLLR